MKLCIAIVDAAARAQHGKLDVLGLGINRVHAAQFPTGFAGALLVIATFEDSDVGIEFEVSLMLKLPKADWESFGSIGVKCTAARDQAVFAAKMAVGIETAGEVLFRAVSGGVVAETHLEAVPTEAPPTLETATS